MEEIIKHYGKVIKVADKFWFVTKEGKHFVLPDDNMSKYAYETQQLCSMSEVSPHKGEVEEAFGTMDNPVSEALALVDKYSIPTQFTQGTLQEASEIPTSLGKADYNNRRDLTEVPFITIDPDTAKDFDDAVYAEKLDNGNYLLKVAIADVAHYIKPESEIFQDAASRANSTYLGPVVYPMLPEELSNGICSLNEKVDRLAMVTSAQIDKTGKVISYTIEPAVINSKKRMTYNEAQQLFDTQDESKESFDGQLEIINNLYQLSEILEEHRNARGALKFKESETHFKISDNGKVVERVTEGDKPQSTRVIESTAILCNEIWEDFAKNGNIPFVRRVHEGLNLTRVIKLKHKLRYLGTDIPDNPSNYQLQYLINKYSDTEYGYTINSAIKKALSKAKYTIVRKEHTGLGLFPKDKTPNAEELNQEYLDNARKKYMIETGSRYGFKVTDCEHIEAYGHTTSPIRRFSDTLNQFNFENIIESNTLPFTDMELSTYVSKMNEREVASYKAENEYTKILATLWARRNLGKVQTATITQCTPYGAKLVTEDNLKLFILKDDLQGGKTLTPHLSEMSYKRGKKKGYYEVGTPLEVKIYNVQKAPYSQICVTEDMHKPINTAIALHDEPDLEHEQN